jgi:hypothetical protein
MSKKVAIWDSSTWGAARPEERAMNEEPEIQGSSTGSTEAAAPQENAMNKKIPTLIGSAIGLAAFLAIALLPAMLYGGYAGLLLAGGIFGTPVEATFLPRALIVFGMVLGVVAVGSLFAVLGAAVGAAVGALTSVTTRKAVAAEAANR